MTKLDDNEWLWTRKTCWPYKRSNEEYTDELIKKSIENILINTFSSKLHTAKRCVLVQCVATSEWSIDYSIQDSWYTFDIWLMHNDNNCTLARFHKYRHQEDTS